MRKIKFKSAPGVDGVTGRLFTFLHSYCPRLICHAINSEIYKGKCADKMIMTKRLIFIKKPGVQKITIKRFRPISLLNNFLKVGDACIVNRLIAGLENAKILPSYMSAYRSGHSTIDAILSLQTFINNADHSGRRLVILSWDVSQAFDKCSRLMVQECLKILGFSDLLIESISKLPTGALARICVNLSESRFSAIPASNACPQGQASSSHQLSLIHI